MTLVYVYVYYIAHVKYQADESEYDLRFLEESYDIKRSSRLSSTVSSATVHFTTLLRMSLKLG